MRSGGLKTFLSLCVLALFAPSIVKADWQGPVEVVKGAWGENESEFIFEQMQYIDVMPYHFTIMPDGKIVIEDGKYKIFGGDGRLIKALSIPAEAAHVIDEDTILIFGVAPDIVKGQRVFLYNINTESVEWIDKENKTALSDPLSDYEVFVSADRSKFIVNRDGVNAIEYSSVGGVLNKFTNRPLLFGKETSRGKTADGKYEQTIEYEDAKYTCATPTPFRRFTRDNKGYLYGISRTNEGGALHTRIYKITKCGKIMGTVDFPSKKKTYLTDTVRIDEDYGEPVFAQNGDVYTWKRTPEAYSILKWTWVDDPNVNPGPDAPSAFQTLPSTSGITLTWTASPQDPGCVTGYGIERSTSVTGPFTHLTTVPTGGTYNYNDQSATAGQTWHYRVRAISEIGSSEQVPASAVR